MNAVFNTVLPVFALILAGWVCGKTNRLGTHAAECLNAYVVWLGLPALLFQAMARITWAELDHPGFVLAYGIGVAVTFLMSLGADLRRRRNLTDASIEALAASYSNTGFMGIPLCLAAFGAESLPASIIATVITACMLFGLAIVLIETDLQQERHLLKTLGRVARALGRNPLLVSPVVGLACAALGWRPGGALLHITTMLGDSSSPCALVTIGLFLARQRLAVGGGAVARLIGLKLLVQPAVTAGLAFFCFRLPPLWSHAALLLSALPIGTGPFMLATLYGREVVVTSQAILISTLLSVVTVSLTLAFFA